MVTVKGEERVKLYESLTKENLIPRAGKPEEVAEAIIFSIENEFLTGTIIDVDGGWLTA